LTAQRRSEIGALQWSEIDLNRRVPTKKGRSKAAPAITLPPTRTKNGREHIIPLSDPAAAIIAAQPRRATSDGDARDLVFGYRNGPLAAWASAKEALDARIAKANGGKPIAHWTLHDLRRSAATIMADRLNVTPHVIEAVLNHVGSRSGVAGTYNRAHYEHDVRIALDRWADHLLAVAEGRASTVVNLPLTA
jgi:integrase